MTGPIPMTPSPSPAALRDALDGLRAAPRDAGARRRAAETVGTLADPAERRRWTEAALDAAGRGADAYLAFAGLWARAGMGERRRDPAVPRLGIALLERALTETDPGPLAPRIHSDLAFLHNEIGEPAAAERHARLAAGYENAIHHLWLAEALYGQKRFVTDPHCAIDLAPLAAPVLQRLADAVVAERAGRPFGPARRDIILVSADAVYFKRFALAQLLSAHRFGSHVAFHFHIVNPDEECHALARKAGELASGMSVTVTGERWESRGTAADRVYYACARMLVAERLAREEEATVVIADADILFRTDPATLIESARGHDIATVEFEGEPLCNRYSASFFVVNRTLPGAVFLAALRHFLAENFRRQWLWMLDQVALYGCARRLIDTTGGALTVLAWPESVLSIHHHPDAAIWPGATIAKWSDSPYTRLRDAILREYGVEPPPLPPAAGDGSRSP